MWEKFKIISSSIWAFVLPFLRQLMSKAGPILAAAALSAVKAVAANATGASNPEKQKLAFEAIVSDLQRQGINVGVDVGTSMINAAIEVAYQATKTP